MSDVIIVGAGPTGLWLACELRLAGVDVTVLERRTVQVDQSRALAMHGRSLEIFGLRGLADRFLAAGTMIPTGHFGLLSTRLNFAVIDSSNPASLFIAQRKTEELIEERAIELGVNLVRGAYVEEVEELEAEVRVEYRIGVKKEIANATYVVGADGARSAVRAAASIEFPGTPATFSGIMGDVILGKPLSAPIISIVNDRGSAMIAPMGDGKHHRIVIFHKDLLHKAKTEELAIEELTTATLDILKFDLQPTSPLWLSRFDNETRLAAQYRKGRIFLAGDAAHIHLPAGGQGMNIGLADATNLGWKLAMAVKGQAPDALLDSYEQERRPLGEYLHHTSRAQSVLITGFSTEALALRAALDELLQVPEANLHLAQQISGFGFSYPKALIADAGESQWRVPDRHLTLVDGTSTSIFDQIKDGKWAHVALEGESGTTLPEWLDRSNVNFVSARTVDGGLFNAKAILVRPDGYAAFTSRAA